MGGCGQGRESDCLGADERVRLEQSVPCKEPKGLILSRLCQLPATPAYVLHSTRTVKCDGNTTAVYWDAGYERPWRAFQKALMAHVQGNTHIGYIRFGLGAGGEDFPVQNFNSGNCVARWSKDGLTAAKWLAWSTSQIAYEASLGSDHPLMVAINEFPDSTFPGSPRFSGSIAVKVAAAAGEAGMSIGMEGMTATGVSRDVPPAYTRCGDWCEPFGTWATKVPLEMLTLTTTTPGGGGKTGDLAQIIPSVITQARVQVLELYPQEWLVADDPSWPGYGTYHCEYAATLAEAAADVGGQTTSSESCHVPPTTSPPFPRPTPEPSEAPSTTPRKLA